MYLLVLHVATKVILKNLFIDRKYLHNITKYFVLFLKFIDLFVKLFPLRRKNKDEKGEKGVDTDTIPLTNIST